MPWDAAQEAMFDFVKGTVANKGANTREKFYALYTMIRAAEEETGVEYEESEDVHMAFGNDVSMMLNEKAQEAAQPEQQVVRTRPAPRHPVLEQASACQQLLAQSELDSDSAMDMKEEDDVDDSQPLTVQTTTRTHRTTETTLAAPATWNGVHLCDLSNHV